MPSSSSHRRTDRNRSAPPPSWLGLWFASLRRTGLLAHLAPEAWHTLAAVLSFTTRDGQRSFTREHLALALGQPPDVADQRLIALTSVDWQGSPLLTIERDLVGAVTGATLAPIELLSRIEVSASRDRTRPESSRFSDLPTRLRQVGLNAGQVEDLLVNYPRATIERQLDWLPQRGARNPAALLLRAVEADWDAPKAVV